MNDERCDQCGSNNVITIHTKDGTIDVCKDCGYERKN